MKKENDWLAINLLNDNLDTLDLMANNITSENTGLESADFYKNNDSVRNLDIFKDNNGNFDEGKFNNYYDSALSTYNAFTSNEFAKNLIQDLDKHPYYWHDPSSKIRNTSVIVDISPDPLHTSHGLAGIFNSGTQDWTAREIAQTQEVEDINGNKLGWTPNDHHGLFKSIFQPALALAAWDEDGYHEENGQLIKHNKGEYKLNDSGEFFYEVLGNRSPIGKDILRYSDTLTVDGTWINNFDVFDSDSIKKSIGGVLTRTAISFAPLLFSGVAPVMGVLGAAMAIAATTPKIIRSLDAAITGDVDDDFGHAINKWDAFFNRFDSTESDFSRERFMTWEKGGQQLVNTGMQLYQQKFMAKAPYVINQILGRKNTLRTSEVGQALSLGFMAATSGADTYASFKQAGANDRVAGIATLGVMGAFFGLMNNNYYKSALFGEDSPINENFVTNNTLNNLGLDANSVIKTAPGATSEAITREEAKNLYKTVYTKAKTGIKNLFKRGKEEIGRESAEKVNEAVASSINGVVAEQAAVNTATKLSTVGAQELKRLATETAKSTKNAGSTLLNNIIIRSTNEGIEELMEEVMQDGIKAITAGADALGWNVREQEDRKLDFGFSIQDILARYATAGIGGFLGGSVFAGLDAWEFRWSPQMRRITDRSLSDNQRVCYLIREGHLQEMINYIDEREKQGKWGDASLSTKGHWRTNLNGEQEYIFEVGTDNDNQNKATATLLRSYLNYLNDQMQQWDVARSNRELSEILFQNSPFKNTSEIISVEEDANRIAASKPEIEDRLKKIAKKEGISIAQAYEKYNYMDPVINAMDRAGFFQDFYEDYNNFGLELVSKVTKLEQYKSEFNIKHATDKDEIVNKLWKDDEKRKRLQQEIDDLVEIRDSIISGDRNGYYLSKGFWLANDALNNRIYGDDNRIMSEFLNPNMKETKISDRISVIDSSLYNYVYSKYGIDLNLDEITQEEKDAYQEEYNLYKEAKKIAKKRAGFDIYLNLSKLGKDGLQKLLDDTKNIVQNPLLSSTINVNDPTLQLNELENQIAELEDRYHALMSANSNSSYEGEMNEVKRAAIRMANSFNANIQIVDLDTYKDSDLSINTPAKFTDADGGTVVIAWNAFRGNSTEKQIEEIEKTIKHEVLAHMGLRQLMSKLALEKPNKFKKLKVKTSLDQSNPPIYSSGSEADYEVLLDFIYNNVEEGIRNEIEALEGKGVYNDEQLKISKQRLIQQKGDSKITDAELDVLARRRILTDEFIAQVAENMDNESDTETINWFNKFINWLTDVFKKITGNPNINEDDIKNLIRFSRKSLLKADSTQSENLIKLQSLINWNQYFDTLFNGKSYEGIPNISALEREQVLVSTLREINATWTRIPEYRNLINVIDDMSRIEDKSVTFDEKMLGQYQVAKVNTFFELIKSLITNEVDASKVANLEKNIVQSDARFLLVSKRGGTFKDNGIVSIIINTDDLRVIDDSGNIIDYLKPLQAIISKYAPSVNIVIGHYVNEIATNTVFSENGYPELSDPDLFGKTKEEFKILLDALAVGKLMYNRKYMYSQIGDTEIIHSIYKNQDISSILSLNNKQIAIVDNLEKELLKNEKGWTYLGTTDNNYYFVNDLELEALESGENLDIDNLGIQEDVQLIKSTINTLRQQKENIEKTRNWITPGLSLEGEAFFEALQTSLEFALDTNDPQKIIETINSILEKNIIRYLENAYDEDNNPKYTNLGIEHINNFLGNIAQEYALEVVYRISKEYLDDDGFKSNVANDIALYLTGEDQFDANFEDVLYKLRLKIQDVLRNGNVDEIIKLKEALISSTQTGSIEYLKEEGYLTVLDNFINIRKLELTPINIFDTLLSIFNIDINGKTSNVLNMIQLSTEDDKINSTLENYALEEVGALETLKNIRSYLQLIDTLIFGDTFFIQGMGEVTTMNRVYNQYIKNDQNKVFEFKDLNELPDFLSRLADEERILIEKVDYLINLAEKQSGKLISTQQTIERVAQPEIINWVLKASEGLNKCFHVNIGDLWEKAGPLSLDFHIGSNSEYLTFFKQVLNFEKLFIEQVNIEGTVEDIEKQIEDAFLAAKFDSLTNPGSISSNPDDITTTTSLFYLLTLLGEKDAEYDFHNEFAKAIQNTVTPFFGQYLAIKFGTSYALGNKYFEAYLKKNTSKRRPSANNLFGIFGSAGTGKTTVIAKILSNIVKNKNINIVGLTFNEEQLENLCGERGINVKDNKITIEKFLSEVCPNYENYCYFDEKVWKIKDDVVSDFKSPSSISLDTNQQNVFIVDEATWAHPKALLALNKYAEQFNIKCVLLGDLRQKGSDQSFSSNLVSSITDINFVMAPLLTTSIRNNNRAKSLNTAVLEEDLRESIEKLIATNGIEDPSKSITLNYTEKNNTWFGEKQADDINELKTWIKNISKNYPDKKIAILSNDDSLNSFIGKPNISVFKNIAEIQGREFDYVFVGNIDFNEPSELFNRKLLYTIVTRSKEGTMFVKNSYFDSENLKLTFVSIPDGDLKYKNNESQFKKYGDSIRSLFKTNEETSIEDTNDEEGTTRYRTNVNITFSPSNNQSIQYTTELASVLSQYGSDFIDQNLVVNNINDTKYKGYLVNGIPIIRFNIGNSKYLYFAKENTLSGTNWICFSALGLQKPLDTLQFANDAFVQSIKSLLMNQEISNEEFQEIPYDELNEEFNQTSPKTQQELHAQLEQSILTFYRKNWKENAEGYLETNINNSHYNAQEKSAEQYERANSANYFWSGDRFVWFLDNYMSESEKNNSKAIPFINGTTLENKKEAFDIISSLFISNVRPAVNNESIGWDGKYHFVLDNDLEQKIKSGLRSCGISSQLVDDIFTTIYTGDCYLYREKANVNNSEIVYLWVKSGENEYHIPIAFATDRTNSTINGYYKYNGAKRTFLCSSISSLGQVRTTISDTLTRRRISHHRPSVFAGKNHKFYLEADNIFNSTSEVQERFRKWVYNNNSKTFITFSDLAFTKYIPENRVYSVTGTSENPYAYNSNAGQLLGVQRVISIKDIFSLSLLIKYATEGSFEFTTKKGQKIRTNEGLQTIVKNIFKDVANINSQQDAIDLVKKYFGQDINLTVINPELNNWRDTLSSNHKVANSNLSLLNYNQRSKLYGMLFSYMSRNSKDELTSFMLNIGDFLQRKVRQNKKNLSAGAIEFDLYNDNSEYRKEPISKIRISITNERGDAIIEKIDTNGIWTPIKNGKHLSFQNIDKIFDVIAKQFGLNGESELFDKINSYHINAYPVTINRKPDDKNSYVLNCDDFFVSLLTDNYNVNYYPGTKFLANGTDLATWMDNAEKEIKNFTGRDPFKDEFYLSEKAGNYYNSAANEGSWMRLNQDIDIPFSWDIIDINRSIYNPNMTPVDAPSVSTKYVPSIKFAAYQYLYEDINVNSVEEFIEELNNRILTEEEDKDLVHYFNIVNNEINELLKPNPKKYGEYSVVYNENNFNIYTSAENLLISYNDEILSITNQEIPDINILIEYLNSNIVNINTNTIFDDILNIAYDSEISDESIDYLEEKLNNFKENCK